MVIFRCPLRPLIYSLQQGSVPRVDAKDRKGVGIPEKQQACWDNQLNDAHKHKSQKMFTVPALPEDETLKTASPSS